MAVELTRSLGRFVADLRMDQIPENALPVICAGFADCVGVMLAGRDEPAVRLLMETLQPQGGEATLLFGKRTARAPEAALVNGTAAHALDFDDVAQRGHPSTVLVPAILAEAQELGASGERMVVAYAAGYETWAELVRRDPDQHHNKGWHPTGIFGAIGAAAACASLRGLEAEKAAHAIAIGASQSSGIMSNFGTMTKPFHAGRASQSGVLAARLADAGFTAALDALEHPQGFVAAVSPAGRFDLDSPVEAGVKWKLSINKLSVKKYPLCFCTHRALDGILDLLRESPVEAAKVAKVRVSTSRRNATILRNHRPRTGLEAKFSMQFAMASAIVAGRAGLSELTDAFVNRDDVQSLLPCVTVEPDDREDPKALGYAPFDLVTIETTDGRTLESRRITQVRGGPESPLAREELWAKFEDCAAVGGASGSVRALFDALMSLEKLPRAYELPGLAT
jgi:2-methylcitrate dehydratase PrpD